MGKKEPKEPTNDATPTIELAKKEEEEEDSPVIKALKAIDDKYCDAEMAMEREVEKLRKQYITRQAPLLEERAKVLSNAASDGIASACKPEDKDCGTPGCPEFWSTALENCNQLEDTLQECDGPVLKYLRDIKTSCVDPDCTKKGYKLEFVFAENPFFTNTSLWVEAHFDYNPETARPWKEPDVIEVKSCTVDWKPGKNITMAKSKGDGPSKKGKKKAAKPKEEPCASIFRMLFNPVKKEDGELPKELTACYPPEEMEQMGADEDDILEMHLDQTGQFCQFLHEELVPYAVRYYTGEACESDDDDEESEEESGDDGDSEEDDSEDEPAPKKGGKKSPKTGPKAAPGGGAGDDGKKTEECKQQ